jgi:3-phenylpropionate/trans-cinnamate dioxygenase ferredoxin component
MESNHDVRRGSIANRHDVNSSEGSVTWVDAGLTDDIADGEAKSIVVGRRMIAVVRTGESYFAIEDICTHDGAPLTGGEIEGDQIICPRHGARFCLRTGEALTPPAYEPVRVFKIKIENGHLWVCTG